MSDMSAGEAMFLEALRRAHLAGPTGIAPLTAEVARLIGAEDTVILLVDHAQVSLQPLQPSRTGTTVQTAVPLEGSVAGQAFRQVRMLQEQEGGHVRLWVPMLDGSDRMGVLGLLLPPAAAADETTLVRARGLASLTAELCTARAACGDVFSRTARSKDMTLAAEIQWQLLPPLTVATHDIVITAAVEPCYEVGGDAFDYSIEEDTAAFAVFDAMGHGLQASLLCVTAVSAYRNARRSGADLPGCAASIDNAVSLAFDAEKFVTGILAELHLETGVLRMVVAGHPDPLLIRGGEVVPVLGLPRTTPFGIGLHTSETVPVVQERLAERDRVLLYTDGVVEARRGGHGEFFGRDRLVEFVDRESRPDIPVPETMRRLMHAVLDHQDGVLQDDATQMLVEWRGGREQELTP